MSLEQRIEELTAAVSKLTEAMKLAATTSVTAQAIHDELVVANALFTEKTAVPLAEPVPQPTFNSQELAADPLAQPAAAQTATPAPIHSTAPEAAVAAPATTQEQPTQSGRVYSQNEFLSILKAYGNGQTADGVAVERAPDGFLKSLLAELGKGNFKEIEEARFAEILKRVPAGVIAAVVK